MQGIDSQSLSAFVKSKTVFELKPERSQEPHESQRSEGKSHRSEDKGEVTRSRKGAERAADIFRQEFMMKVKQSFSVEVKSRSGVASAYQRSESVKEVAAGILSATRSVIEKNKHDAPGTIAAVRSSVEQAASASQKFMDTDGEAAAVRETVNLIKSGLDELKDKVVSGKVSELSLESKVKQSSSIRIRTQEGDVVKFNLRRVDKTSFSDESILSGSNSAGLTELSVSSRSRLSIVVKGDLNEAEQEAIRTVFATAERLADEFFSGDIGAALEIAAGLEFDSEQLARVSMRFRSEEKISVSQSIRQFGPAEAYEEIQGPQPLATSQAERIVPESSAPQRVVNTPSVEAVAPAASSIPGNTEVVQDAAPAVPNFLAGFDSLLNFLGKLADYLDQTPGIDHNDSGDKSHPSEMRLEISQSFKLEILRAVMSVSAPEDSTTDAELSGERIQQLDVLVDAGSNKVSH